MRQKHIVVVDGLWVGHHPAYVKIFAKILVVAGYQVSVLCPAPGEVESWVGRTVSAEVGRFKAYEFHEREPNLFEYLPGRIRNAFSSLTHWWQVSRSVKALCCMHGQPDLVFFAWLDSYVAGCLPVRLIDWRFPFRWSGLYFHPRHMRTLAKGGHGKKGLFPPPEALLSRSKWASSVAVLDAGVVSAIRVKMDGKPVVALPDFTDEVPPAGHCNLAETVKLKARSRKIIALIGSMAQRKGLLTLIRVVKQAVEKDWYFVFAGILLHQTFVKAELAEIQEFFRAQREECFIHLDKIPDDAQFNAVIKASDILFAVYEDFPHSSNLVTKAAMYGKRVLVSSGGYMEEVVNRYKLGESVPARDVEAAISALRRLTRTELASDELAGMQEYAKEQSQDKLRGVMLGLIERLTDCPSSDCAFSGSAQG